MLAEIANDKIKTNATITIKNRGRNTGTEEEVTNAAQHLLR